MFNYMSCFSPLIKPSSFIPYHPQALITTEINYQVDDDYRQSFHLSFQSHALSPYHSCLPSCIPKPTVSPRRTHLFLLSFMLDLFVKVMWYSKNGSHLRLWNWTLALVIANLSWLWFLQLVKIRELDDCRNGKKVSSTSQLVVATQNTVMKG